MSSLRKIHVTTGVSWVEAPEVGLYVLCGCPADSVKHLMRRGLIVETEADGVFFETGPNAILLSDVMVQNGAFCNLAEFPVLQMLYRQGMIIPGHPNNKGAKPLLIGRREQVDAQMRYIHRGNYGLLSRDEMVAAGTTPETADELMAMKLAFAFGAILHPADLIDSLTVADSPVTLPGGVILRRLGLNRYLFELGADSIEVDLNLPPGITYEPPYTLGNHRIDRSYFSVIHVGEGDGWDPNRPCMSSIVVFQGKIYLIDAGPNLQYSLTSLGIGINEVEGVFHTHCHDDHFAGLTTLMRADKRIKYFATPLVCASVKKKLAALLTIEESDFADYFDIHDLAFDEWNNIDGLEVKPILSPHPVETSILMFRALWENGYRTYAHWADIASRETLSRMVTSEGGPGISRDFYERVIADYSAPADIKKIDAGGGMIHGQAEDFRDDASRKIVLAHVARSLTVEEKRIGSGAPFATAEVLISGSQDFIWSSAFQLLAAYFPKTPRHDLRLLINCPIAVCNPETILLHPDHLVDQIHLLVTGAVEMIEDTSHVSGVLSAGALIGEMAALEGAPAGKTYRAISFVQSLMIPGDLYREFVRRNGLLDEVMTHAERRNFLRATWLCAEALTETTLHNLAKGLTAREYPAGVDVRTGGSLAFLRSGTAELMSGGHSIESLGPGAFWGEESALFATPPLFRARGREPIQVYLSAPDVARHVPVMRWKLLECHKRRVNADIGEGGRANGRGLRWREEYGVNVQRFDHHHRNLIMRANAAVEAIACGDGRADVDHAFEDLFGYASFHFGEEERLLEATGASWLGEHRVKHARLLEQISELERRYRGRGPESAGELAAQLAEWVVGHIVADDRRTASFLNAKGIY